MNWNLERFFLAVFFTLLTVVFFVIFYVYLMPIGLISDDFVILERAKNGEPLWTIHYTWTLNWVWKWLAEGAISLKDMKGATLLIHVANAALLYLFLVKRVNYTALQAGGASILLLLSAAGIEALAWNCCLGYTLTLFFILASLLVNSSKMEQESPGIGWLEGSLQAFALMTWDWGVLVFPLTALSALFREKRPSWPKIFIYFIPSLCMLMAYFVIRMQSNKETIYAVSSLFAIMKFLFASPLIVLAPNVSKELLSSLFGVFLGLGIWAGMLYLTVKERRSRFFVSAFLLTLLPWLIGGHPSSRYYYLSAPFLFSLAPLVLRKNGGAGCLTLLLSLQFYFFYERAHMWSLAANEVQKLGTQFQSLALNNEKRLVIINAPDAFGPESFPMRPQAWHCGLETLCPDAVQIKVSGAPHIWADGGVRMSREEIFALYPNDAVYEVVSLPEGPYGSFSLVSR